MNHSIVMKNLSKSFGAVSVLRDCNLEIRSGEFLVIVGPSGCGKSTLLRILAGLEPLTAGDLFFDGNDVRRFSPAQRGAAMVFQNYALYPHMSVFDNMAFGLKIAGLRKSDINARIEEAAKILGLTKLLDRKPGALSGGQKQRVAMGRAMVKSPRLFLFDEPLSNLDAQLRVKMRAEIAALHKRLGVTTVYVTHDQTEAMTLADRIVVLNAGGIEQVGTPLDLYHHPKTQFVASFMGNPPMNLCHKKQLAQVDFSFPNQAEVLGFRAEDVRLCSTPVSKSNDEVILTGEVRLIEILGLTTLVHVQISGSSTEEAAHVVVEQRSVRGGEAVYSLGQNVHLAVSKAVLYYFDRSGQRVLDVKDKL